MTADREFYDDGECRPPAELERRRWQRISRLLRYAHDNLPFYRQAFAAAGYAPGPIRCADEFAAKIPRTRKADLIAATRAPGSARVGIEAIGRNRVSCVVMTSGTLGFNTFAFLTAADLNAGNLRNAARELWLAKVRPGMRVLTLSPAWHALALLDTRAITAIGAQPITPWGTFAPRFSANFLDAVARFRPEHMLVTVPALRAILEECERQRLAPRAIFRSVRYVATAGEALSPAFRRHVIRELGLDDLFERGGSSDGMFGGSECWAHRGHHIFADLHYIEVVDPQTGRPLPPGRRGSAVVTNLTRDRSVYVRFDTEDVAEIVGGDCPCGRTHPLVELYGRLSDSVRLPGRIVAPADVRACLDELPPLMGRSFRLEPLERDGVSVRLAEAALRPFAGAGDVTETLRDRLTQALQRRIGVRVSVVGGGDGGG